MNIDFSASQLFLSYLQGKESLATVLAHPAYQTVVEHARMFGDGLSEKDVLRAFHGLASPFYGLKGLQANLGRIQALAENIRDHQTEWTATACEEFHRLLPAEDPTTITVYPILGYDMGIGLHGNVCMNLNVPHYLDDPWEFFYYLIHEAAHVLYERSHVIPPLERVVTAADWWNFFGLWLQSEGFAVHAPYRLRQENGRLGDTDYQVLGDPSRLEASLEVFRETRRLLESGQPFGRDEILRRIYGDERILYRAGCEIFLRIERSSERLKAGEAIQAAFYLSGKEFLERYGMDL
jgi:hypothetical protein